MGNSPRPIGVLPMRSPGQSQPRSLRSEQALSLPKGWPCHVAWAERRSASGAVAAVSPPPSSIGDRRYNSQRAIGPVKSWRGGDRPTGGDVVCRSAGLEPGTCRPQGRRHVRCSVDRSLPRSAGIDDRTAVGDCRYRENRSRSIFPISFLRQIERCGPPALSHPGSGTAPPRLPRLAG
jgi:hypothetical protein